MQTDCQYTLTVKHLVQDIYLPKRRKYHYRVELGTSMEEYIAGRKWCYFYWLYGGRDVNGFFKIAEDIFFTPLQRYKRERRFSTEAALNGERREITTGLIGC